MKKIFLATVLSFLTGPVFGDSVVVEICALSENYSGGLGSVDEVIKKEVRLNFERDRFHLSANEKKAVVQTSQEKKYFGDRVVFTGDLETDYNAVVEAVYAGVADLYVELYTVKKNGQEIAFVFSYPGDTLSGNYFKFTRTSAVKIGENHDGDIMLPGGQYCNF